MPPRAVGRRDQRLSREPEFTTKSPSSQPRLQKPNLPKLAETPASRRQYTYGSSAEPPPSRPGRGLRLDQPQDLGNAVGNLLSRQQADEVPPTKGPPTKGPPAKGPPAKGHMPPPPPPQPSSDALERDELADEAQTPKAKSKRSAQGSQRKGQRKAAAASQDAETGESSQVANIRAARDLDDMRDDRSFGTESDIYGDASIASLASTPRAMPQVSELDANGQNPRNRSQSGLRHVQQTDSEEQDDLTSHNGVDGSTTASAKKRLHLKEQPRRFSLEPDAESEASHLGVPQSSAAGEDVYETEKASSLFRPARKLGMRFPRDEPGRPDAGGNPTSNLSAMESTEYTSSHSEADEAIQRDIEARETASAARQESWRDRWLAIDPLSPFRSSPRHRTEVESSELEHYGPDEEDDGVEGVENVEPGHARSYFDSIIRLMDAINDWITGSWNKLTGLVDLQRLLRFLGITAVVLAVLLASVQPGVESSVRDSLDSILGSTASGVEGFAAWLGDVASSIHLPFRRDDDLSSLWELDDDSLNNVEGYLRKFDREFELLKKAGKLHDASLEKLHNVVPKVVHMKLKDGKPVVAPEFWHAMRDLLREDGSFLTVDESRNGDVVLNPDRHWRAIASKLASDPSFTSKFNFSMDGIESRINSKMSSFWDGWVKENDNKISAMLGSAIDRVKSAASEEELNNVVKKLVKGHLQEDRSQGVVVTRDEFLRHLKNEFAVHRSEIRAELNELQPRIEEIVRESARLANAKDTQRPAGMTREDVTTLVNGLLRNALANTNLEALARGKIHAHWDADLKNQINYFSVGAGAIIDRRLTSPTYTSNDMSKAERLAHGLDKEKDPIVALEPWHDQGDCWCAIRSPNHRRNPHSVELSVILGREIIPQHVVIEHILPGATIDPGARPRDIEIYASIEDSAKREVIRDFSDSHFPELDPSTEDWNAMRADFGTRFVKIGQFTYEGAEIHDGVHVHRLSSELVAMRAETDQVVVRATSNYGAEGHTCFYRVRLYGHQLESDD